MQNIPSQSITITQWKDAVVEAHGYSITDPYVEMFWLPVLGPTATWLLRRFSFGLIEQPNGMTLDIHDLARSLGVAYSPGKHNSFTRALQRCTMFGVAHQIALLPTLTVADAPQCRKYRNATWHAFLKHFNWLTSNGVQLFLSRNDERVA